MDKGKPKKFTKKVDTILWKEWDPIGNDVPEDEYTSYALTIVGKARRDESKEAILEYLYWAENDNMGLECTREQADSKNSPIVDKIIKLAKEYKI